MLLWNNPRVVPIHLSQGDFQLKDRMRKAMAKGSIGLEGIVDVSPSNLTPSLLST